MNGSVQSSQQGSGEATRSGPVFTPPADIIETENDLVMLLDVPGAQPDTVDIALDRRVLTVTARSNFQQPEGYALVHAEYMQGDYERRFVLSERIDGDRVDAVLRDGVLRLTMPKAAPSPAKKIPVKSAAAGGPQGGSQEGSSGGAQ